MTQVKPPPVHVDRVQIAGAVDRAIRAIPPAWPLAATVAVNPFLARAGERLAVTAARLRRAAGIRVTMPRRWFRDRIASGRISDRDLADALFSSRYADKPVDVAALKACASEAPEPPTAIPTVARLVSRIARTDWEGIVADRISAWASAQFDRGQALWRMPRNKQAWPSWRVWAIHDLTPEILGLDAFAAFVEEMPVDPLEAICRSVAGLAIPGEALDGYFEQILWGMGGWAQLARYELWQAELGGDTSGTARDLLAIGLVWEAALFTRYGHRVDGQWAESRAAHAQPLTPGRSDVVDEILQDAADRSAARHLELLLAGPAPDARALQPAVQAVFCIDVRSEVFRRAFESLDPAIRTSGFAGFFGISPRHRCIGSNVDEQRFPVLLTAAGASTEVGSSKGEIDADTRMRYAGRARRAWRRFRMAAVSSFAFVEAMGPVYAAKLFVDSFHAGTRRRDFGERPRLVPNPDDERKAEAAERILRAMSMTHDFARIVLLVGHGASVTNNPHASALQCGACGGYSGDVNARLAAALLNDPQVRLALRARGVTVPEETLFVAALHDTTTDDVTLFGADGAAPQRAKELQRVREWLAAAGKLARAERATRLPRCGRGKDIPARARDWAETRPEWGLAGCQAFIAAPRGRTIGRNLAGRAFLHDYDFRKDAENGYGVLELILTAPVVVASWISLQYFGSCVAPEAFGAGNKLLHNVVGGVGVLEGNSGPLRTGLPWQSVHDGRDFVHEPVRLTVYVEAPTDAIARVLAKHGQVRELFDNGWLHLVVLDDAGRPAARYAGQLKWQAAVVPSTTGNPDFST
ncbi:MAG: DUF2309 family protein [Alphaproteobacteria bacterium]|nr:DUF2309 family protein [Alphaproteobacteria bacterium]